VEAGYRLEKGRTLEKGGQEQESGDTSGQARSGGGLDEMTRRTRR